MATGYRVGVDVGGTFTDFVLAGVDGAGTKPEGSSFTRRRARRASRRAALPRVSRPCSARRTWSREPSASSCTGRPSPSTRSWSAGGARRAGHLAGLRRHHGARTGRTAELLQLQASQGGAAGPDRDGVRGGGACRRGRAGPRSPLRGGGPGPGGRDSGCGGRGGRRRGGQRLCPSGPRGRACGDPRRAPARRSGHRIRGALAGDPRVRARDGMRPQRLRAPDDGSLLRRSGGATGRPRGRRTGPHRDLERRHGEHRDGATAAGGHVALGAGVGSRRRGAALGHGG